MSVKKGFRTSEVSNLTGLTRRQLDHWDRTGLFRPSLAYAEGKGSARFYSYLDVVELRVMKQLLDAGLSTKRLRSCLSFLKDHLKEDKLTGLSLLTDGKGLYLLTGDAGLVVDLARRGQVAWVTDVGIVVTEVDNLLGRGGADDVGCTGMI
ncbi:MAG TPA: MerR family transcriptional regulator [Spirochaetia bacterium]|nr:MerR family transcriptional regulator [Spirochaetia bacterium]